jgi:N6-adenosine-specific RNA methylase IME4
MIQPKLFDLTPKPIGRPIDTAPEAFDIILCDPPWSYNEQMMRGQTKTTGSAEAHYNTMTLDELKRLPVNEIAKPNSLCIMWTTGPQLKNSIELMECDAWGFKYITIAFIWDKQMLNPSSYFMSRCELAIVGKRGAIPKGRETYSEEQFLSRRRTRHSEKPEEFRKRIDRTWPNADKLELFSRRAAKGWFVWGNQAPECVPLPALDIPW